MGARDSDDDIQKFLPDLKTIMREADPARGQQKLQDALDNPELDRALEEARQRETKEGEPSQAPSTPNAVSPWAKAEGEGEVIEKAALPSAMAPKGEAPPVTTPVPEKKPEKKAEKEQKRRPLVVVLRPLLPSWVTSALALLAVVGPLVALYIVMRSPSSTPQEALDAGVGQAALPVTAESAAVRAAPGPSSSFYIKEGPGSAPSTGPVVSATAAPPETAAGKVQPGVKPRGTAEDPYSDAASGGSRASPTSTPSATTAPAEPPATTTPTPRKKPVEETPVF